MFGTSGYQAAQYPAAANAAYGQQPAGQQNLTNLYGNMMNMMTNMSAMNTMGTMLAMNSMAAGQPGGTPSYGYQGRKNKNTGYGAANYALSSQPFDLIVDPQKAKIEKLMAEAPIPLPSNANWVGLVHEYQKKNPKKVEEPELVCLREHGKPHNRRYCYRMSVKVEEETLSAIATATTKKKAKQEAGKRLAHLIGKDKIFNKEDRKSKKRPREFEPFPMLGKIPELPEIKGFPLLPKMPELPTLTKEDTMSVTGQAGPDAGMFIPPGYNGPPCPPPSTHPAWNYQPFCHGPPPPRHPAWKIPPWCNWEFAPPIVKQYKISMLATQKATSAKKQKTEDTPGETEETKEEDSATEKEEVKPEVVAEAEAEEEQETATSTL